MKHKKGFTLIEVVVVIVLSSVLLAGLVPLLPVAQKQMYHTQNVTTASQAGESIYKYIVDTLDTADRIWIGDNSSNKPSDYQNWNTLTVQSGTLLLNGASVYDEDYQDGCMLTLSANGLGRTNLELNIELTKVTGSETEVLYTRNSAFSPAAMSTSAYACIEGSIGSEISTMRYSADGVNTRSGNSELVIYFQQAQNTTIPTFTPNTSPAPDVPPTAEPSALTVTLQSTLELSANETKSLVPTVTLPQNTDFSTVSYQWSGIEQNSGFTATPQYGENGNITRYEITGVSSTKQRVTLTVSCTANGIEYTQTVSCTIVVSQPESSSPPISNEGDFILQKSGWNSLNKFPNIAGQIVFVNIADGSFAMTAYAPFSSLGESPAYGKWEIVDSIPNADNSNPVAQLAADMTVENTITPLQEGAVTIKFTSEGRAGSWSYTNGTIEYPELVGKTSSTTFIFYDGNKLYTDEAEMMRLSFYFVHENASQNGTSLSIEYSSEDNPFAQAVVSLKAVTSNDALKELIYKKLSESPNVTLATYKGDYLGDFTNMSRWNCTSNYNPVSVPKPATEKMLYSEKDDCYQAVFSLNFNSEIPDGLPDNQVYEICPWIWVGTDTVNNIWFHPFSNGLTKYNYLTVSQPIPKFFASGLISDEIKPDQSFSITQNDSLSFSVYNTQKTLPLVGTWEVGCDTTSYYTKIENTSVLDFSSLSLPPQTYYIKYKTDLAPYSTYQYGNPTMFWVTITPASQIYSGSADGVVWSESVNNWVGQYSSNLENGTVFVDISQPYSIAHYCTDYTQNNVLSGKWEVLQSVNGQGETDNTILSADSLSVIQNVQDTNPLSLKAEKEGIVTLKHTSTGNYGPWNSWNDMVKNLTAQVTVIFYDAEKVANGTSELLKSSLTLTTGTDEIESDAITTAYTAEGKVFAKATFSLDVVPKWNWDESKVNVEEIIRNALESNPPSVSLSTFKTSMTSWSDVSAISKPSNAPLIASSKNGTYQATFPLAFSDYVPTADLTTSLYAWLWTENSTILGGIDTVFNPTLPNRCTVTVTPATPILSTSLIPVPDSLVPFNSSLTVGVGQGLIIYALDDNGQSTLAGTWTITDTKNESRTVTIQNRDALDLSKIFEPSNSSKNFLTEGEYKITYKSDIEPYTNATIVFYVKVKPIPVLVAFTELVSEASQRKHYFNHSSVTATYSETVNLYAFVKNSSTYTQASGYWTIMKDDNKILQDKVEGTVVSGSQLELKFNSQAKTCTVNVRFTSTSNPQDTLDLVISVSPSKLAGVTKPVGSNTNGQLENGDFTIGNGKIVLNTKLDLLPEEDKLPAQSKYLRWYVNDTVIFDSYVNSGNTKYVVPSSNGKDLLVFNISDEGKIVTFNGSNGTGSSRTVKLTLKYSFDGKSWIYYDAINITTK